MSFYAGFVPTAFTSLGGYGERKGARKPNTGLRRGCDGGTKGAPFLALGVTAGPFFQVFLFRRSRGVPLDVAALIGITSLGCLPEGGRRGGVASLPKAGGDRGGGGEGRQGCPVIRGVWRSARGTLRLACLLLV